MTTITCQVAAMAEHAKRLTSAIKVVDEAMNSEMLDCLTGSLDALNAYISHLQPHSAEGALYQIGLISHYTEWDSEEVEAEAKAAIERMTYAVAEFLEMTNASRRNRPHARDFYLPHKLDPRPLHRSRGARREDRKRARLTAAA